jgi:hypothetical protein
MYIFAGMKEEEGGFNIQNAVAHERSEPRAVPPEHSGI